MSVVSVVSVVAVVAVVAKVPVVSVVSKAARAKIEVHHIFSEDFLFQKPKTSPKTDLRREKNTAMG